MSYIDTINHSYVGSFAGLPVYHPLENLDEEGIDEFSATPKNLVIGGGSGEHPGLVVKNMDVCVWKFFNFLADISLKETDEIEFFNNWEDTRPENEEYSFTYYSVENIEYQYWSMDAVADFVGKVRKEFDSSVKYYKDKSKIKHYSVEDMINVMFGEFVYFTSLEMESSKKLLSPEFKDYIKNAQEELSKSDIYIECPFESIKVPPKGYPVSGRQMVFDQEHGSRVKWGLSFEEEGMIDPILNDPDRNKKQKQLKM